MLRDHSDRGTLGNLSGPCESGVPKTWTPRETSFLEGGVDVSREEGRKSRDEFIVAILS